MEKEICINEYVRTNEGYLGKLIAINKQDYNYLVVDTSRKVRNDQYPATYLYLKNENIKNHKEKLLELVEEGDYVNGYYVYKITKTCIYLRGKAVENKSRFIIKSIATYEQFKNIEYKVGE